MASDFETDSRFERYSVNGELPLESVVEFNSALRQCAEAEFGAPAHTISDITLVNEMRGLLDISALPLDDDQDEIDPIFAADALLELIRGYLSGGGKMYLRGQSYVPADLDTVNIRAQFEVDLTSNLEITILEIEWETLLQAIKERRFAIDPNPYAELFALTTEDRTVIGELLFSSEPTAHGFTVAEQAL
jgi:hypothetical protein